MAKKNLGQINTATVNHEEKLNLFSLIGHMEVRGKKWTEMKIIFASEGEKWTEMEIIFA